MADPARLTVPARRARHWTSAAGVGVSSHLVHPIEHLRYVARSAGAPQGLLMVESTRALASFHDDPVGLVTACRRIVSRQLSMGGLWWVASRLLCSPEPLAEARAIIVEVEADRTDRQLAIAIDPGAPVTVIGWPSLVADALVMRGGGEVFVVDSGGEGASLVRSLVGRGIDATEVPPEGSAAAIGQSDLVIIEANAASATGVLASMGSLAAAAVAHHRSIPVWAVVGVGRSLPTRVWDALISRHELDDEPWEADNEVVPMELISSIVGPGGLIEPGGFTTLVDCPIAPELFKADIT